MVGPPGFEPGTSCTPSKRASQAAPRPDIREETPSLPRLRLECRSFGENDLDISEKTQAAQRPVPQFRTRSKPVPPEPRTLVTPIDEEAAFLRDFPVQQSFCISSRLGRVDERKKINLSVSLAGQAVGVKEVEEGIWLVSFMDYDLGYIDLEEKTLQPLPNPFGPKVSPMS